MEFASPKSKTLHIGKRRAFLAKLSHHRSSLKISKSLNCTLGSCKEWTLSIPETKFDSPAFINHKLALINSKGLTTRRVSASSKKIRSNSSGETRRRDTPYNVESPALPVGARTGWQPAKNGPWRSIKIPPTENEPARWTVRLRSTRRG